MADPSLKGRIETDLVVGGDGMTFWWPTGYPRGAFRACDLRAIADELDRINEGVPDAAGETAARADTQHAK